jgi:hypothetical protein
MRDDCDGYYHYYNHHLFLLLKNVDSCEKIQ